MSSPENIGIGKSKTLEKPEVQLSGAEKRTGKNRLKKLGAAVATATVVSAGAAAGVVGGVSSELDENRQDRAVENISEEAQGDSTITEVVPLDRQLVQAFEVDHEPITVKNTQEIEILGFPLKAGDIASTVEIDTDSQLSYKPPEDLQQSLEIDDEAETVSVELDAEDLYVDSFEKQASRQTDTDYTGFALRVINIADAVSNGLDKLDAATDKTENLAATRAIQIANEQCAPQAATEFLDELEVPIGADILEKAQRDDSYTVEIDWQGEMQPTIVGQDQTKQDIDRLTDIDGYSIIQESVDGTACQVPEGLEAKGD